MSEAKNIKSKTKKATPTKAVSTVKKAAPAGLVSEVKTAPSRNTSVVAKTVTPSASTMPSRVITTEVIAARAYTLWEQAGRPNGRDQEYWLQAENQLKENKSFAA